MKATADKTDAGYQFAAGWDRKEPPHVTARQSERLLRAFAREESVTINGLHGSTIVIEKGRATRMGP